MPKVDHVTPLLDPAVKLRLNEESPAAADTSRAWDSAMSSHALPAGPVEGERACNRLTMIDFTIASAADPFPETEEIG